MSSNIEIEDINAPWNRTPKYFIETYFESNEKEFQKWIFENFKSFIEDVNFYDKGPEWNNLKWDILKDGSNQYNSLITTILDQYRENVTLESYKELIRLKSEIVRDCDFYMIKNVVAEYDWEAFTGMTNVDFAHLPWDSKKYPVWIESIYNGTIRKIDVLLDYYESIGYNQEQPPETVYTEADEKPGDTDVKGPYKKNHPAAKYFALYHWILIKLGKEQGFEKNENDQWPKERIKNFAKKKYGPGKDRGVTLVSEERFYQEFKGLDITNKVAIARSFGPGYKEKLIEISGNDADVIHYLKDWPS